MKTIGLAVHYAPPAAGPAPGSPYSAGPPPPPPWPPSPYYPPPPPQGGYLVVQPPFGQTFDINRFGPMRVVGLVGGGLALLSLVLPWLSIMFLSINVFTLLQLAPLMSQNGVNPLMIYSGLVAGVTAGLGLIALIARNEPGTAKVAAVMGLLTFVFSLLFIVGVATTGGSTEGLHFLGPGVFVCAAGGLTMLVGAASHVRRAGLAPFMPRSPWMGQVPQAYAAAPPAYGPGAPPTAPASPCPRCGRGVVEGQPACRACGLELSWV